jgi:hypothetical protein
MVIALVDCVRGEVYAMGADTDGIARKRARVSVGAPFEADPGGGWRLGSVLSVVAVAVGGGSLWGKGT